MKKSAKKQWQSPRIILFDQHKITSGTETGTECRSIIINISPEDVTTTLPLCTSGENNPEALTPMALPPAVS